MELIPYEHFERLRLSQFHPDASRIATLLNWEFMGAVWVGEADGFTAFLCPEASPDTLGSIELDLRELPEALSARVLAAIQLPLQSGMSLAQVQAVIGIPTKTHRFVPDRASFDFVVGSRWPYQIGCTIHESQGLIHVGVIRQDHLCTFTAA